MTSPSRLELFRRLRPFLWPAADPALRRRVVASLACLCAARGMAALVPLAYRQAVELLGRLPSPAGGNWWAGGNWQAEGLALCLLTVLAYGAARLGQGLFSELQEWIFARVSERAVRQIGLQAFEHLHRLSMRFHLDRQTGSLSRMIERGTRGVELMLRLVLFRSLPTVLELLVASLVLGMMVGWSFSLVVLLTLALYTGFTMVMTEWRTRFRREVNASDAEAGARAIDSLLNYETVKYFTREQAEAARYDRALAACERTSLRARSSLAWLNLGQAAIITGGLVTVMLLAAGGVASGRLTVGDFVMVNTWLIQLTLPLGFLGVLYREMKQAVVDMETLFALFDQKPEVADAANAPALDIRGGEVVFDHVSFAYDQAGERQRPILHDICLTIPAGQTVAVVGRTGSGKSTLGRLLFRFWDVSSGSIRIDGQDIRQVSQHSLRSQIGVVSQEPVLFNDSLLYNIAYGAVPAGREAAEAPEAPENATISPAVLQAVDQASLGPLAASLPDGLHTRVGERGLKLSGGEKQRVALARVLLKDPPLLILDEATSALDTHTEQAIQAELAAACRQRTCLVIAHRLSTVVSADRIVVLEDGRIVEQGSHRQLLEAGGAYARLWQHQQGPGQEES